VKRLDPLVLPGDTFVVTNRLQKSAVMKQLPQIPEEHVIVEPVGRNTAPCIGLAALHVRRLDPEAVMVVLPADHIIRDEEAFRSALSLAVATARESSSLLTIGITPTHPETGYGYIQFVNDDTAENPYREQGVMRVKTFAEKPNAQTAEQFLASGDFLWNSGMFVWRASTLMDSIRRFAPENYEGLMRIARHWGGPEAERVVAEVYPSLPKISVDYAVMEPASRDTSLRVAAVPMPLQWLDVGSWATFAKTCPMDEQGNALAAARHVLTETRNTLVLSTDPEHLVVASGCDGMIVIHTPDATLVCRSDQAESVKELQQTVLKLFGGEYT
jgi:mannose-1-phosphate guanylyltransferase